MTGLLHFGAFCVAIGSTIQALRWISAAVDEGLERRKRARTRTDHLGVRRYGKQVQIDWTAWTFIAVGAWAVALGGL
ncbi:hypothetical protein ACOACO_18405 [Nocardioides sp. CPCC 205120]|uniref:hypothetical protein n=1 Tax=Nocardioides sp. CPCC 205120 TaxID=3406462 RepID=UPI003B5139AF